MSNVRFIPLTADDGTKVMLEVSPFHSYANGKVLANVIRVMYQDPEPQGTIREFPHTPIPKTLA